ncbi:MAG: RpiB/LacA/LacB family sugar-phosphate isomerase, partial [Nitrospinaceae bacterium]|nr:RpiB/LacA/LacB family sugar-phosphate isomerase [Nitrospinaceae bacterium]
MDKIAIASDHGGYDLKAAVEVLLRELGYEVDDLGPQNADSVDYPDYGISLARAVAEEKVSR